MTRANEGGRCRRLAAAAGEAGGGAGGAGGPGPGPASAAELNRRSFLSRLCVGLGGLVSLVVAAPVVTFVLAPVFRRPRHVWRGVGPVDQFSVGETVEVSFQDADARSWAGPIGKSGAWLRRDDQDEFTAFALDCTHLGCPVRWEASAQLFMCPCHGGVYYADGKVAGGPPPHPLIRYQVRVKKGQVEIRTAPLPIM
jgi:menaquinol-cytochrome c reductase iron-sulfur subunit